MKIWAVTLRTDIRSKTDIRFKIKAYNRTHVVDMLDLYWVMDVEELSNAT